MNNIIKTAIDRIYTLFTDTPLSDSFGRIRMSETGQRFDQEFIYDKEPLNIDEVMVGGATAVHDANSRDVTISLNSASNGVSGAMYSHYDIPYTPGNSQNIDITGTLNENDIVGGTTEVFIRTTVTGSTVETAYPQADWNKNKVSNLDIATSQIFNVDFQSLKVGRIRYNLVRNGLPVCIHEVHNDNVRKTGYWQTPTLPIFWRGYNAGGFTYLEMGYGDEFNAVGIRYKVTASASAKLRVICATVKSEGGYNLFDMPGVPRAVGNGAAVTKTVSNVLVPILSIRPSALFGGVANRGLYIPTSYTYVTDNPIRLVLLYRPTLTNASWANVNASYSGMDYDVSATAVSGGVIVDDDYIQTSARNTATDKSGILGKNILSLGRTGVSDILSYCAVRNTGTNAAVQVASKWKELR